MPKKLFVGAILTVIVMVMAIIATAIIMASPYKIIAVEFVSIFLTLFTMISILALTVIWFIFGKRGRLIHR